MAYVRSAVTPAPGTVVTVDCLASDPGPSVLAWEARTGHEVTGFSVLAPQAIVIGPPAMVAEYYATGRDTYGNLIAVPILTLRPGQSATVAVNDDSATVTVHTPGADPFTVTPMIAVDLVAGG